MKKLISLLLTFAMLFSLAMPAMAAEETKTIYFDNTAGWETVYAYAWNDSGDSLGAWNGTAMTKVEGTESIYSIEVPTDAVNIIFNNSYGTAQTPDLTIPTDGKNLFTYNTDTWSVYGDAGVPTPTPPSTGGSTNDSKDVTATYTPTYTVTVNNSENGKVEANPAEGVEGTKITLTVTPDAGYELDQLTVKDASDYDVTVEEGYTFTMPASDVTVTATFKEVVVPTYAINIAENIENGTVVSDKAEAKKNDPVTLTITPAKGYELDTLIVDSTDVADQVQDGKYTFTMDEAEVSVTATFKKISYTITVAEGISNGSVSAPATANMGDTVTVTVAANAGYAYVVNSLTVTNDTTGEEITVDEASKTFVMPASAVTVTASFEKLSVTSANIVWGNMSFTYDDTIDENTNAEKGWTPAAEAGAGTVTVTNTGDTTFTASATYTPAGDFGIIGSLDAAKTLASSEFGTFTLTLTGKPNQALNNQKIGTVTIEIVNDSGSSDEDESDVITVTDEQELRAALEQGGNIKLGDSITINSPISLNNSVTLNLNGKTIFADDIIFEVWSSVNLTILGDGTLDRKSSGSVIVSGAGTVNITGGTFDGQVAVYGGNLNISGGQIDKLDASGGTCTITGGTFLNNDPSAYVDLTNYTVTESDGTWTVTAN